MMRKLAGVLAAMMILVLGSTSVYAAASPTARDLLFQLLAEGSDEPGGQDETEGSEGPDEPVDLSKEAEELARKITGVKGINAEGRWVGLRPGPVSGSELSEAKEYAASLGRDPEIRAIANVTLDDANSIIVSGLLVTIAVSNVDSDDNVYVIHKLENGSWETIRPSVSEKQLIVVMYSFSPVAVVLYPKDVIITPTPGTSGPGSNPSGNGGSNGGTSSGNTSGDSQSNSQTGTQDQNGSQTGTQDQNSAQNNPQTNTQDQNSAQNNPQTNTQDQNSAQNNPQNQANSQSQNNPQNQTNNQTQSNNNNQNSNQTNDNNQSNSQVNNQNNPVNVTQNVTVKYPSKDQYEDGYAKGFLAGYVLANKTSSTSSKKTTSSKTSTTSTTKKVVKSPKTGAAFPALPFALMSAAGLGVCGKKSRKSK